MISSTLHTGLAPTVRGALLALLGAFFSACYLIPWKLAAQHGTTEQATLLLLTSAAFLNTLALTPSLRDTASPLALAPTLRLAAVFAVLSLAGIWCSAEAVRRVSGALLAVFQRCDVLVVGVLAPVVLRERTQPIFWVGAVVALCGLVVLSTRASVVLAPGPNTDSIGVLCGLGSAACIGAIALLTRKHIHTLRPMLFNALRLWLSVLCWFAVERTLPAALSPKLVLYTALAAFFGPFLARLAMMESARHVAASTTVLASLTTPPMTLVLGFVLLGTLPSAHELLGGALVLAGVALPVVHTLRVERAPHTA
jgi:drug/metabolite transporter (DMT)-like permease